MTWFRVDDGLAFHAKTLLAGNAAMGMWVRAGAWCSQHLTDGHVPAHVAVTLGSRVEAARLVSAGLWASVEDGYQFHDWHQANPVSDDVERKRAQARERMRSVREKFAGGSREQSANFARSDANPDPTRPDPSQPTVVTPPATRTAKQPMTEDWQPSAELVEWARQECPQVDTTRETANFVDFFLDKGEKRPGWDRSWKRWMREAQGRLASRPGLRAVGDYDGVTPGRRGSWDV